MVNNKADEEEVSTETSKLCDGDTITARVITLALFCARINNEDYVSKKEEESTTYTWSNGQHSHGCQW